MANTRKANPAVVYTDPLKKVTAKATAAVTGNRFLKIVAGGVGNHPNVQHSSAAGAATGVSDCDTANGGDLRVLSGGDIGVLAGAALTAGTGVESDANGKAVVLASGVRLGTVLADTASGQIAPIRVPVL